MRATGICVALLAIAGAGVLAGCGGGDDDGTDSAARGAAQQYVGAYNARDFEQVCKLLSDGYKANLLAGQGQEIRCPQWFDEQTSGVATTLTLGDVEEEGNQATAQIRSKSQDAPGAENELTLRMQRDPDGAWEIVDLTTSHASG